MAPSPPKITSFLIKVASRCNLACDYCYVYRHADQSWRDMPAVMEEHTIEQIAHRIGEYAHTTKVPHLLLVFHGGEPLLAGPDRICAAVKKVRNAVPPTTRVDVSLQTNGLLLTEEALALFVQDEVCVSVSIDGPPEANDLHRLTHAGGSSYPKTLEAIRRLERHPEIYAGLIAVIDPVVKPDRLLAFFHELNPPCLDLLLPDANHLSPPRGRDRDPDLYLRWLLRAFDLWFDHYPDLKIRTFDALLECLVGLPSRTDAFGLGDVSLLCIETDGSYHDLDVLKITRHGATCTGLTVWTASVEEAARSPRIEAHRHLLTLDGLSDECRKCPVVNICGGGAVPHRYDSDGFRHPTVYCREMLGLITLARKRFQKAVLSERTTDVGDTGDEVITEEELRLFDDPRHGSVVVEKLYKRFALQMLPRFLEALRYVGKAETSLLPLVEEITRAPEGELKKLAVQPSVVLWATITKQYASGIRPTDIAGETIPPQHDYVRCIHEWLHKGPPPFPRLHRRDSLLRLPFAKQILFEPQEMVEEAACLTAKALGIIAAWDSALIAEISRLSPEIQFIRDPSAHPEKAVSFSDNSAPGCLYVSVRRRKGWISAHDLADSIIHEHRHQKLYLLQAAAPIVAVDAPLVHSPWREDLRPPSGLFHAVFVFCGLLKYWRFVEATSKGELKRYASEEVARTLERLRSAREILFGTSLTRLGRKLATLLYQEIG